MTASLRVKWRVGRDVWGVCWPPAHALTTYAPASQLAAANPGAGSLKTMAEMPGPRSYPLVGCLPTLLWENAYNMKDVTEFYKSAVKKYGPIFKFKIPNIANPLVLVSNPDDVEVMARATMDNPIREGFDSLRIIRENAVDNYFEGMTGLLTENGEEWSRVRSRVQTPMMKPKNVSNYLADHDQVSLQFMDRMAELQTQHGEMPADFQSELYKWALESVGLVALNRRMGCLDPSLPADSQPMQLINVVNDVFQLLNDLEFSAQLWKYFPSKKYRTLEEKHNKFIEIAESSIHETEEALRANKDQDRELSLMETLLVTPGLTRKDVITLILDMLFAGIDTTSHTVGFLLYLLARNPAAQTRLQEEVDSVLGDYRGPLTPHHMAQLSYTKAAIKETMRIFPLTMGTGRTLHNDIVLSGYLVPKNWVVMAVTIISGWDEANFTRAKEFLPERWLRDKPLGPIHPYASLPFGIGTRMCIGRRIAEQELYTFLARVMQRFTVDYKYEDIGMRTRLVNIPDGPLRFHLTERR